MATKQITIGSTYKWKATIKKNGVAWDMSGGSLLFEFTSPSGTVSTFAPDDLTTVSQGVVYYTNATGLFNAVGEWKVRFLANVGGTVQNSLPTVYSVAV